MYLLWNQSPQDPSINNKLVLVICPTPILSSLPEVLLLYSVHCCTLLYSAVHYFTLLYTAVHYCTLLCTTLH